MLTKDQATALAKAVHQDAPEYVASFIGENDAFDADKFVKTFMEDLRTARKTERDSQYHRGLKKKGEEVEAKIKSLAPDLEWEEDDAAGAVDAFARVYREQLETAKNQSGKSGGGSSKNSKDLTVEQIKELPAFQEAWQQQSQSIEQRVADRLKEAEEAKKAYERKEKELVLSTRRTRLRSQAVQWAADLGIALADADKNPELRREQIDTLMYRPEFDPTRWVEDDKDELVPVDEHGQRLKDQDFHPMSGRDLLKKVNVFGVRKFDPSKGSPSATSTGSAGGSGGGGKMTTQAYYAEKERLTKAGDREALKSLTARYLQDNPAA